METWWEMRHEPVNKTVWLTALLGSLFGKGTGRSLRAAAGMKADTGLPPPLRRPQTCSTSPPLDTIPLAAALPWSCERSTLREYR